MHIFIYIFVYTYIYIQIHICRYHRDFFEAFSVRPRTINPSVDNYEESLNSLAFADRCKNVFNLPSKGVIDQQGDTQDIGWSVMGASSADPFCLDKADGMVA